MEAEKRRNNEQRARLQRVADAIKNIEYINIPRGVVVEFLTSKHALIVEHLKAITNELDPSFVD